MRENNIGVMFEFSALRFIPHAPLTTSTGREHTFFFILLCFFIYRGQYTLKSNQIFNKHFQIYDPFKL